ncbi:MAG: HAMP domain-containing histidine kinase [Proteobacteria bacterium]|nr:HAMP domain-containing histidine kinase [Pseudomonadota bacterium]
MHVVLLPAVSGLLFFVLGLTIFFYLSSAGRWPFLWFHFFVGNYLILCPDFHLTHQLSYVLLLCFAMIPATMMHFALLFPEPSKKAKANSILYWIPYVISLLILIPYVGLFHQPSIWVKVEYIAFFYMVFSYLFWIAELVRTLRKPQLEFNRVVSKYLLIGQIIAFSVPLIAALAIFLADYPFPLNLAAPLALLFPISLFMGVILGRLRRSQMELVQSEKSAALGSLLAGLAHEINNPMTFVYSSMEPLKEMLASIQSKSPNDQSWNDVNELISVVEEGATRSKDIIESFRYFSHPEQKEHQLIDLHEVLDQSLRLLKPKCENRIHVARDYGQLPYFKCQSTEMGQVFINLLSNACYAIPNNGNIEIATHADSKWIEISIKDSGTGMSKDVMSKMFDPFYTTKPQGDGTGLGLSITLGIVRKYDGLLETKSEINKGTEMILKLPVNI